MAFEDIRRSRPKSTSQTGPFEAIVVNNLDTKYMGTLQVELLKSTSSVTIRKTWTGYGSDVSSSILWVTS